MAEAAFNKQALFTCKFGLYLTKKEVLHLEPSSVWC